MYKNMIEQAGDFMRDPLDFANRDELYQFAQANGVTEITEAMYMGGNAGEKMKRILRARGLTNIRHRAMPFEAPSEPAVKTTNFDDFISEPSAPLEPRRDEPKTRAELAKECKKRGIKMARTDTKEKLQERLSVQNAA